MVGVTNEKSYEFHFLSTPLKKTAMPIKVV